MNDFDDLPDPVLPLKTLKEAVELFEITVLCIGMRMSTRGRPLTSESGRLIDADLDHGTAKHLIAAADILAQACDAADIPTGAIDRLFAVQNTPLTLRDIDDALVVAATLRRRHGWLGLKGVQPRPPEEEESDDDYLTPRQCIDRLGYPSSTSTRTLYRVLDDIRKKFTWLRKRKLKGRAVGIHRDDWAVVAKALRANPHVPTPEEIAAMAKIIRQDRGVAKCPRR